MVYVVCKGNQEGIKTIRVYLILDTCKKDFGKIFDFARKKSLKSKKHKKV